MSTPQTKIIDGVEVTCVPLPEYPRGANLLLALTQIAMPALSKLGAELAGGLDLSLPPALLAASAAKKLGPDGAGKLISAIRDSLLALDEATFTRLSGELLTGCRAIVPKASSGAEGVDLNTPAKIQHAITASGAGYGFLFRLLAFALGANYGGFFGGAFGGGRKAADPPASETPTP